MRSVACGDRYARQARYQTSFATVVTAVRDALGAYQAEELDELRRFETAWHEVDVHTDGEAPLPTQNARGRIPTTLFVRYTIRIVEEKPYRVVVDAQAGRWLSGTAVPQRLSGADEPGWLVQYRDKMVMRIHRRLRDYEARDPTSAHASQ